MACKKHPHETTAGVCPSCLRDRLLALIASQNNSSPINPHPPFHRSASPYFLQRKSVFFRSPPPNGDFTCRKSPSVFSSVFGHSRSSFSWISGLIWRKKSRETVEVRVRVREEEDEGEYSGYSTDSSAVSRRPGPTPVRPPVCRRSRVDGGGRGFSGFAVCLSPLVRSNPNRRRGDGTNGRIRRHVSFGDYRSNGGNRSRKLGDFGRFK